MRWCGNGSSPGGTLVLLLLFELDEFVVVLKLNWYPLLTLLLFVTSVSAVDWFAGVVEGPLVLARSVSVPVLLLFRLNMLLKLFMIPVEVDLLLLVAVLSAPFAAVLISVVG